MAIKKKEIPDYKEKYSTNTKYKPTNYYYCGEAFANACGLPGPVMGGINMFLGHSDTAKTNAMIIAAADAQKRGDLPVFVITEKKWSWEHAVELGLQAEKNEDGEWFGDFIFNDSFDYIEQATDFINELMDEQEKGNIPRNLLFCWDSIGSVPCQMTFEGKGGKMHNASVLQDRIGLGLHSKISKSKKESYPFYNTMIIINQAWVDMPENKFAQPEIKARGGEAAYYAAALVFLFGNQKKAGINRLDATKNGRTVQYAIRTKVSILKNHVNGMGFKDGKLIATPHGFIADTKDAIDAYKKQYSQYWNDKLGGSGDFVVNESASDGDEE